MFYETLCYRQENICNYDHYNEHLYQTEQDRHVTNARACTECVLVRENFLYQFAISYAINLARAVLVQSRGFLL